MFEFGSEHHVDALAASYLRSGRVQVRSQRFPVLLTAFPLHADYFAASARDVPLFLLFEFINSSAFLDLTRRVTRHGDIA